MICVYESLAVCVCAKTLPENSLFAFLKVFLHTFFAGLATRKYQTIRIHTYAQFSLRLSTPEPDTDVNVYLCVSVCPEMIMCVRFFPVIFLYSLVRLVNILLLFLNRTFV